MLLVCLACAWPAPHASRRWRGLLIACLGSLALVTLARGVLGAFFTESYPALRAPHPVNVAGALLNHIVLTLSTIALLVGWHEEAEAELRRQATSDGLTGLMNRRAWVERAEEVLAVARRYGERVSVLMIDINRFKAINDSGGHAAGDRALQHMAGALRDSARRGDLVGRYGGEEFLIILPGTVLDAAVTFAERVRERIENHEFVYEEERIRRTVSCGVAAWPHPRIASRDELIRSADEALYVAKERGRDRVIRFDSEEFREHARPSEAAIAN